MFHTRRLPIFFGLLTFAVFGTLFIGTPPAGAVSGAPSCIFHVAADMVIGQSGFTTSATTTFANPAGIVRATDGGLYIADRGHNRVLYYPAGTATPSRVYGQPDFTTFDANHGGVSAASLFAPAGLALDSQNGLYVADAGNNRLLYFAPGAMTASRVYGQPDFVSNGLLPYSVTATSLYAPAAVVVDSGNTVYVADTRDDRVLQYPAGSTTAILAYGQPDLTSHAIYGGYDNVGLHGPQGLALAPDGGLYIADTNAGRVLYFPQNSTVASRSYGTPDPFTAPTGSVPTELFFPTGIAITTGDLYVSDTNRNRVYAYSATSTALVGVYGQPTFAARNAPNPPTVTSLAAPSGLVTGANGDLYVADGGNNRILHFPSLRTAAATQLVFCAQPFARVNSAFSTQPQVMLQDAAGNSMLDYSGSVTVAIKPGTGTAGAVLSGTTSVAVVSGVATFTDLALDSVGQGFVLTASASGLSSDSAPFPVHPPITHLDFSTQPVNSPANAPINAPAVVALDSDNQPAPDYTQPISLDFTPNNDATIQGTLTVTPINGVATFPGLIVTKFVDSALFTAHSGSLTPATSATFSIGVPHGGEIPPVADLAYGQADLTTNNGALSGQTFALLGGVARDSSGGTYVVDSNHNRVLYFPAGSAIPTRVYGQSDFTSTYAPPLRNVTATSLYWPTAVAVTPTNDVYIADGGASRVLFYPAGSTTATRVYGQPNVNTYNDTHNPFLPNAQIISNPTALAIAPDGGFYVTDTQNNRVLYFPPWHAGDPTGGIAATQVYGQLGFYGKYPNSPVLSAASLSAPGGIAVTPNGDLYIADTGNNRVLYYPGASTTATRVYGQSDFTTATVNSGGISAASLAGPRGVAVAANGDIYVADTANNRILAYSGTTTTAGRIYGQPDATTGTPNTGGISATSLSSPANLAATSDNSVIVSDYDNHRVLIFAGSATTAAGVLGQPGFTTGTPYFNITGQSLNAPSDAALAPDGSLYVADTGNNRVLYYPAGSTTATRVYGQPNMTTNSAALPSATSLNAPASVALDADGNLYVSDTNYSRILFYPSGTTTATRVYGQPDFTSSQPRNGGLTAHSLDMPQGITIAHDGGLYVTDPSDYRILYFPPHSTTATRVYGQPDFTSGSSAEIGGGAGVVEAPNGDLYVARVFDGVGYYPAGSTTLVHLPLALGGTQGGGQAQRIALSANGDIYVSDTFSNRTWFFPAGSMTPSRIYGQPDFNGTSPNNGGLSAASLNGPVGVTPTNDGTLYLTDSRNNRILRFPPAPAPAPADHLIFSMMPGTATAHAPFGQQPEVIAVDKTGQVDPTFSGDVTLTLKSGVAACTPILGGSLTAHAVNGRATFTDISASDGGKNCSLTASSSGLPSANSLPFRIWPGGMHLVFTTQPQTSQAGTIMSTIGVSVIDEHTALVDDYQTGTITIGLITADPQASITFGSTTRSVNTGIATFSISITKAGTYTLSATSSAGLTGAQSNPFAITAGQAYALVYIVQPAGEAGAPLTTQPVIAVTDIYQNFIPDMIGTVSIYINNASNAPGAVLNGTTQVAFSNGIAAFTDLMIDTPGINFSFGAYIVGSNVGVASNQFTLGANSSAPHLVFSTQPVGNRAGSPFTTQPVVSVLDSTGVLMQSYSGAVKVSITPNAKPGNAQLGGTQTVQVVNGTAVFTDLTLDIVDTGFTLNAHAPGTLSAYSQPFDSLPPLGHLVFIGQPIGGVATNPLAQQPVLEIHDEHNFIAYGYSGNITLTITPQTGTAGAQLGGTVTLPAIGGYVYFTDIALDRSGVGYTLTATAANMTNATSAAFNVLPTGNYMRMQFRTIVAATTDSQYSATLSLQNLTSHALPAGIKISLTLAGLAYDPTTIKADPTTLVGGAHWVTLSVGGGRIGLDAPLAPNESRTLTLLLPLKKPARIGALRVRAILALPTATYTSNSLLRLTDDGAAPVLSITGPAHNVSGAKAQLVFRSTQFAVNEPVFIQVNPGSAFSTLQTHATSTGQIVVTSVKGLRPGTYTVTIYGWQSGITATGTITLT